MRLDAIAALVRGGLEGDPAVEITGVADIMHAGPGDITFLANPRYAPHLGTTRAGAVLLDPAASRGAYPGAVVRCAGPNAAFAAVCDVFCYRAEPQVPGIAPTAVVGAGCRIDPGAAVGAQAVIADGVTVGAGSFIMPLAFVGREARIGRDCRIHPHAAVLAGSRIGDRVLIHAGAVIGSDGFGYETTGGIHRKINQTGIVEIGDDVEIGACVTVDRARFGRTVIGAGTKIDNLVQVAHNVRIGRHCLVAAQTGLSGSTVLGDNVTMAGRSGSHGHIRIGDGAVVTGHAVATKDIAPGQMVSGYPARPAGEHRRSEAVRMKLPAMARRLKELERKVAALETQTEDDPGHRPV
ncbi:MAG: UDP-3-O-(3-hydroxymyristoyl)glucosamine N-acyltransferase [Planctomycetota bacterium]